MNPWLLLVVGGLGEMGFTTALRYVDGFRSPGWSLAFLAAIGVSMGCLAVAARTIPLGTAYAVWAGVGAGGTAVLGIAVWHEPADWPRLALLAGLVGCIVGLKSLG